MKMNENGRSMIEMLGVLAIIGVLSVGGIAGYSKAMSKYRTNKVIDQATMLITNIRTTYAQQQTYSSIGNAMVVDLGLVPEEMIIYNDNLSVDDTDDEAGIQARTQRLRNVFSGPVMVASSPVDAADATAKDGAFKITFYGLSRDACIQIATSDWGAGSSSGLVAMHMWDAGSTTNATGGELEDTDIDKYYKNGKSNGNEDEVEGDKNVAVPGADVYKVPFTVAQAQTACACPNRTTCAVSWKYF